MAYPVALTIEDWARVRYEYECTERKVADICAEHGISEGTFAEPREALGLGAAQVSGAERRAAADGGADDRVSRAGDSGCDSDRGSESAFADVTATSKSRRGWPGHKGVHARLRRG